MVPHAGVLAVGDNWQRARLAGAIARKRPDFEFVTVRHPAAVVSSRSRIGMGCVILAQSVVDPDSMVGAHSTLWTHSVVEHECALGEAVTLAPGVKLGGRVRVGDRSFLGLGAVVNDGASVGADVVLGSQSAVVHDIPDNALAMGVPARVVRTRTPGEPYLERSSQRNG